MPVLTPRRLFTPAPSRDAQPCATCRLRAQALCAGAPFTAWASWQAARGDVRLGHGEQLHAPDTLLDAVYIVRSGVLKLDRLTDAGERRVLRLVGAGQAIGLEALAGEATRGRMVALTDASLCRLPARELRVWQQEHPAFALRVAQALQAEIDEAYHWMTEFQVGPLRRRLLRLLLACQPLFGGNRIVLPSREDLGAMLGVTLETASRAVSDLRRHGVLLAQGRGEFVIDVQSIHAQLRQPRASPAAAHASA